MTSGVHALAAVAAAAFLPSVVRASQSGDASVWLAAVLGGLLPNALEWLDRALTRADALYTPDPAQPPEEVANEAASAVARFAAMPLETGRPVRLRVRPLPTSAGLLRLRFLGRRCSASVARESEVRSPESEVDAGARTARPPRTRVHFNTETQSHRDAEQPHPEPLRSLREIQTSRTPRTPREDSGADEPSALRHSPRTSRTPREDHAAPEPLRSLRSLREIQTPRTPRTPREDHAAPEPPRTPRVPEMRPIWPAEIAIEPPDGALLEFRPDSADGAKVRVAVRSACRGRGLAHSAIVLGVMAVALFALGIPWCAAAGAGLLVHGVLDAVDLQGIPVFRSDGRMVALRLLDGASPATRCVANIVGGFVLAAGLVLHTAYLGHGRRLVAVALAAGALFLLCSRLRFRASRNAAHLL